MDSYPSLIPIKRVLKVSADELKTGLQYEKDEIFGETTKLSETSDLESRIELQLETRSVENGKYMVGAYLTLFNIADNEEATSNFAFYIKSANFLKYDRAPYASVKDSWGDDICTLDDLFNPENKFVVDEEFVVEFRGIICIKDEEKKSEKAENCLSQRLWKDEEERDFTLVVGMLGQPKTVFKIHKCVLALCSPVFSRMFKTDMKEKQEGKVDIIDFDLDTVETAVAFCYDQEIFEECPEWQKLVALHRFADKYDIDDLKRQTELYMAQACSLENVCEITNAAINLNAPKLQDFCFRFLLMALREGIPVKDIDKLENGIAADLLKKASSIEYL